MGFLESKPASVANGQTPNRAAWSKFSPVVAAVIIKSMRVTPPVTVCLAPYNMYNFIDQSNWGGYVLQCTIECVVVPN